MTSASIPARSRIRCPSGSPSAATPPPPRAPARSACRWPSRSSAACRSGSRRSPRSTAAPRDEAGHGDPGAQHQLPRFHRRHLAGGGGRVVRPPFATMMDRIGRERGWPPMTRERLRRRLARCAARTSSAARRRWSRRSSSSTRSSVTSASCCSSRVGLDAAREVLRSIELFGTEVAPAVRSELAPRAKPERTKVSDGVARITTT